MTVDELQFINNRIIGPDEYGKGCPTRCGCPLTPLDCPQFYKVEDIEQSAVTILDIKTSLHFANQLERQHTKQSGSALLTQLAS